MSTSSGAIAPSRTFRELAAGAGFGLLVGLIVGLAVTQAVGTLLASLLAGLGAFLGLRSGGDAQVRPLPLVRLAGFGWLCAVGLVGGIYLRAGNRLSPAPADRVHAWTSAGFDTAEARAFVAYEQLGILQEGWTTQNAERVAARGASVLFSDSSDVRCEGLRSGRHRSYAERVNAFDLAGGPWSTVAQGVSHLDPAAGQNVLEAVWSLACPGS